MKPKQQTGNANATNVADSYIVHSLASVNKGYRHTYHVMPPVGWMNDPNGFCYAFGKYQLFFQFYPYGAAWNSMHWGHYTSEDFVKWQLQPTALAPSGTADRDGCYSGSGIVKDGKLYLMYTSVLGSRQTQSLAVSSDGVHFEKLGEVIKSDQLPKNCARSDFRDPKVFKRGEMYYSVMGSLSTQEEGQILLYRSPDLFKWEYVGTLRRIRSRRAASMSAPTFSPSAARISSLRARRGTRRRTGGTRTSIPPSTWWGSSIRGRGASTSTTRTRSTEAWISTPRRRSYLPTDAPS